MLKEIAPKVERALVLERSFPLSAPGAKAVGAIEAVGRSIGVDVSTVAVPNPAEIERAIGEFAQHPNGGLLPTANPAMSIHRKLIVALAAQYRLPASYPYTLILSKSGGLVSYSVDAKSSSRQAASYVDRILKGEKPADLPVQAPTKYELTINSRPPRRSASHVPQTCSPAPTR